MLYIDIFFPENMALLKSLLFIALVAVVYCEDYTPSTPPDYTPSTPPDYTPRK